jgi:hypothetical protein
VPQPPKNPLLWGKTVEDSILDKLTSIKSTDLEETLLVLPFEFAMRLLSFLDRFISQGKEIELCVRCVLYLLTIHHSQIIANQLLVGTCSALRCCCLHHAHPFLCRCVGKHPHQHAAPVDAGEGRHRFQHCGMLPLHTYFLVLAQADAVVWC